MVCEKQTSFNAGPAAAGYLYQARLALLLCVPHLNLGEDIEVSIERFDDISFERDGNPIELLQAKHHINRVGSLSDTSVDLWKTLRVWSNAAAEDPSLPSHTKLVLLTTGTAPLNSAASLLRPLVTNSAEVCRDPKVASQRLAAAASSSQNETLKPAFKSFLGLAPRMRAALLSAVEIVDGLPLLGDLSSELERSLRLVSTKENAKTTREMLEGWWWPRICQTLAIQEPQAIAIAEIEAKIDDIREMLKRDSLIADLANVEPSATEVEQYDNHRFVKQLQWVGVGSARQYYAKRDYYRAFAQRSKWTREHVVLDDELKAFEQKLLEEWQPRFAAMCEAHEESDIDSEKLREDGQSIYKWVETEARFPFRFLEAKFLNVGSYHMLANDLRVGWHRDFEKLSRDEEGS